VTPAETALARRRHLAPVVDVVLLEQPRGAVVGLAADPDHALDRVWRVLLEEHEMPELRLKRTARQREPEAEHPVREDAVVAELHVARAERAEPPLDLRERGLV